MRPTSSWLRSGPAVPALEGLSASSSSGGAQVDFSREGTLAYVPGAVTSNVANPIDWITRDGKTSVLRATKAEWADGDRAPAVDRGSGQEQLLLNSSRAAVDARRPSVIVVLNWAASLGRPAARPHGHGPQRPAAAAGPCP